MKVLLITKGSIDYQCDLLFDGLYRLLGSDLTHDKTCEFMYKDSPKEDYRYTAWYNLPICLNDNSDLENKIKNRYFSIIIYGTPIYHNHLNNKYGNCDYIELVSKYYNKNEVLFIDGRDENDMNMENKYNFPLFKREIKYPSNGVYPISFAIPDDKITKSIPNKIQKISNYIPQGKFNNNKIKYPDYYVYKTEESYYQNYKDGLYGITHKKTGWDCMRHYEILANYCIPYFYDIQMCPEYTMVNFPKDLIKKSNNLFEKHINSNVDDFSPSDEEFEILNRLFEYTKLKLTTTELAKYIIDKQKKL